MVDSGGGEGLLIIGRGMMGNMWRKIRWRKAMKGKARSFCMWDMGVHWKPLMECEGRFFMVLLEREREDSRVVNKNEKA